MAARSTRRSAASAPWTRSSACCCARARRQPLLVVFEDLHWIDAETQALLDSLVESLPTARLLLLVNYRPEYQHGWGEQDATTRSSGSTPCPPESADGAARRAARRRPGLRPLKHAPDRADRGQPVLPRGERADAGRDAGCWSGERGAYRLDAAAPRRSRCRRRCRRSWPRASTGCRRRRSACSRRPRSSARTCRSPLLAGDRRTCPRTACAAGLAHLQAAEFLYETQPLPGPRVHLQARPDPRGGLRRACSRSGGARSTPGSSRPSSALYADRLAEHVERLAHHALRGELWEQGGAYLRQAGPRRAARSAHREAVGCFEQALEILEADGPQGPALATAVDVAFALRASLAPLGEFTRTLDHLRRAAVHAEALGDRRRLGWVAT